MTTYMVRTTVRSCLWLLSLTLVSPRIRTSLPRAPPDPNFTVSSERDHARESFKAGTSASRIVRPAARCHDLFVTTPFSLASSTSLQDHVQLLATLPTPVFHAGHDRPSAPAYLTLLEGLCRTSQEQPPQIQEVYNLCVCVAYSKGRNFLAYSLPSGLTMTPV